MSKTTKIIAALGVVAGLGVAALPAFTYAASVSGNADVYVEIEDAIAMTITGNNDGQSNVTGVSTDGFGGIAPSGATKVDTFDTTANPSPVKAGPSSSYKKILPNAVYNATDGTFASTITVYTNSYTGYTLNAGAVNTAEEGQPAAYQTGLVNTVAGVTIPAGATLTAGTPAWAYNVSASEATAPDAAGTVDVNGWNALVGAGTQIAHEDNATTGGTEYVANYGVSTAADQATGIYKGTIVYTATTK